jgi:hypothetical protein
VRIVIVPCIVLDVDQSANSCDAGGQAALEQRAHVVNKSRARPKTRDAFGQTGNKWNVDAGSAPERLDLPRNRSETRPGLD